MIGVGLTASAGTPLTGGPARQNTPDCSMKRAARSRATAGLRVSRAWRRTARRSRVVLGRLRRVRLRRPWGVEPRRTRAKVRRSAQLLPRSSSTAPTGRSFLENQLDALHPLGGCTISTGRARAHEGVRKAESRKRTRQGAALFLPHAFSFGFGLPRRVTIRQVGQTSPDASPYPLRPLASSPATWAEAEENPDIPLAYGKHHQSVRQAGGAEISSRSTSLTSWI